MKLFIALSIIIILTSCSSKDHQFCDCLKAGDELNQYSSKLFNKVITPKLHKEMMELKDKKKAACKNYQTMSGAKMLELQEECK